MYAGATSTHESDVSDADFVAALGTSDKAKKPAAAAPNTAPKAIGKKAQSTAWPAPKVLQCLCCKYWHFGTQLLHAVRLVTGLMMNPTQQQRI